MNKDTKSQISETATIKDYFALIVILGLAIGYYLTLKSDLVNEEEFSILEAGPYMGTMILAGIFAFIVSRKYWGSEVFGRAYFFLGLGYVSWFIADSIWYYYDFILKQDAYPASWDLFYIGFYVMASIHLVLNIRYFKPRWDNRIKAWLIGFPIIIVMAYIFSAYSEWGDYEDLRFDLFYGTMFMVGSAVVFTLAIFGAAIFRQSILGLAWLLLAGGLVILGVADFMYYSAEITESFTITHPANAIWPAGFMVIIYALFKHMKVV